MAKTKYYDGTKLLSMKDINGQQPEIYIADGTRTAGKTTYFRRLEINRFLKYRKKFGLLFRTQVELKNVAYAFFKEQQQLFFPTHEMTEERMANGKYLELMLDGVPCGYALALSAAKFIKNNSHIFTDIDSLLFDEFQPLDNLYLTDELGMLQSIHTSVARGMGKQVRYVPLYMVANSVSLLNPYYVSMGISERLTKQTKFLKGDGFVMEHTYNESAAKAQKESAFNRALGNIKVIQHESENVYMDENKSFIEKMPGNGNYICTIRVGGEYYSLKEYQSLGVIYCDTSVDLSNPRKISLTVNDHDVNFIMLTNQSDLISRLRWYFINGHFRFRNLQAKRVVLKMLSYY